MNEKAVDPRTSGVTHPSSLRPRRRMFGRWLAAGLGAGLLFRAGTRSAEAANGDPVLAGQTVDATAPTQVRNGVGYTPDTSADAIQGYATGANNAGLFGRNNSTGGIGVTGAAPSGTGVFGESSNGYGVGGRSSSSYGVFGKSTSSIGVLGESSSSYPTAAVHGNSLSTGPGVSATASGTVALYAKSIDSIAVYGNADGNNGTAVYGHGINGGRAAYFNGNVDIAGNLTVTGSYPKSAAVPHPDGMLRRLYCMESPESWFEDFGRAQLSSGRAQVTLDSEFAALIRTDGYHVFPIPEGDCKGLYISNTSSSGFEVRELQGGTSSISFSYRLIARRRDIPAPRLEKVQLRRPSLPGEAPGSGDVPPAPSATGPTPSPSPTATSAPTLTPAAPTAPPPTSTPAQASTSAPTPSTTATPTPTVLPTRTPTPGATGSPAAT